MEGGGVGNMSLGKDRGVKRTFVGWGKGGKFKVLGEAKKNA